MASRELAWIREVLAAAQATGSTTVEAELEGIEFKAKLAKSKPTPKTSAEVATMAVIAAEPDGELIRSQHVGYFRSTETPTAAGTKVKRDQELGSIAALGIANYIQSPCQGEIVEWLVQDNDPVQFGQPLGRVRSL